MEKLRLLIADADERFTEQAQRSLKHDPDIEVVVEHNGRDALNRARCERPDVVLFDPLLPELDGISLLRGITEMPDAPTAICCTRFFSDVMLEAMRTYGASYVLFKPIEQNALHPVLRSCMEMRRNVQRAARLAAAQDCDAAGQSAFIRNYLISLGVPSKLIGCSYLTEAIRLARADASLLRNLSKGLYEAISESMGTTPPRIERCIRNAISAAYQHGELRLRMNSCPTNKEFINYILRNLSR